MPELPFSPGRTQVLTVGATSATLGVNADAPVLRVANVGTIPVFIRTGVAPQMATVADYPIFPNAPEFIGKGVGANMLAAIAVLGDDGEAATLYVTDGHMG